MSTLHEHYRLLLGLDAAWRVDNVKLDLAGNQVTIWLEHCGGKLTCPECGAECSQADTAPERTWRHLDTMQFKTEIRAATPRSRCSKCGVKTVEVPWAGKHSRFTLLFEAVAINVLQAASSVQKAAKLLGLGWKAVHSIMERAVARGLAQRSLADIKHVGIDEKSFGAGHDYVSIMTDLDGHRVLEVTEDRTTEACDQLWKTLTPEQSEKVESVSVDMWPAFMHSSKANAPKAEIVHDKFHVSKHLNEAVDKVRRRENRELQSEGDNSLKGTRQLFLYKMENLDEDSYLELLTLQKADLKTGRAWSIKENFREFWSYRTKSKANWYFGHWYNWAIRSRLEPIKKVARMLKNHLEGLLSYATHRVTNSISEGFNSRIQSLKSAARGFRNFANYRLRILFYCGRLEMKPTACH